MKEEKMNVIEKAIGFAVKAHAGALRKGTNLPYILHPMEAAAIAAQMTDDQDVIAAAVLHDAIEDTETTAEDIRKELRRIPLLSTAPGPADKASAPLFPGD